MEQPPKYEKWAKEPHARWINMGHTFGQHVMEAVRDYALAQIPIDASAEAKSVAEKAVLDAIYGFMMLLDGIDHYRIDDKYNVQYVLKALVLNAAGEIVESFELAPGGDGLCMGYHAWIAGEFEYFTQESD